MGGYHGGVGDSEGGLGGRRVRTDIECTAAFNTLVCMVMVKFAHGVLVLPI